MIGLRHESRSLAVAPAAEPVVFSDFTSHAHVCDTTDQTIVEQYIAAARDWAETFTRRAFIDQTWDFSFMGWPSREFRIPLSPVSSITSITYIDVAGDSQVLASGNYQTNLEVEPARVKLTSTGAWPSITSTDYQPVIVRAVCGYGSTAADVPDGIRTAILMLASHWYENREPVVVGAPIAMVPHSFEALLWRFRLLEID